MDLSKAERSVEIWAAAQTMQSALTLQEKDLAKDLTESYQLDGNLRRAYRRAPVITLGKTVGDAIEATNNFDRPLSLMVLYCDTLIITANTHLKHTRIDKQHPLRVNIYARKLIIEHSSEAAFKMTMTEDSELRFFTGSLPKDFKVEFELPEKASKILPVLVSPGQFGVTARYTLDEGLTRDDEDPPDREMATISYLDLLNEDGSMKKRDFSDDNLPRLVYFQFLVAATHLYSKPALALDLLNYVCSMTAMQTSISFNVQANSLRRNLLLSSEQNVFNVPSVNVYSSKQVLKARLIAAKGFEDAFQAFVAQERSSANWEGLSANLLAKSDDALEEYAFLKDQMQKAYDAAIASNTLAEKDFKANESGLTPLSNKFKDGIDEWCKEQKAEAAKEIFLACVGVVAAVAATVATAGAAAPTVALAAGGAVKAASTLQKVIATLNAIYERIKKIFEKLKPTIEKLKTLTAAITKVVSAIRQAQSMVNATDAIQKPDMTLDVYNATKQWDLFNIEVEIMEQELRDYNIPNKGPYLKALKTVVINGKVYLQTQANLCQQGNSLALILLKTKLQSGEDQRLRKSLNHVQKDGAVLNILKRAMFDRLLTIRSFVFLDFNTYAESYLFHSLCTVPPVNLSPVKPVVDYLEDAARLQGAVTAFGSTVIIQERKFTILTTAGAQSPQELGAQLSEKGQCFVSILADHPAFRGFSRIRLGTVRCYLEGAQPKDPTTTTALRLLLQTNGRFADIGFPAVLQPVSYVRSFVGDARTLLFEYNTSNQTIVCDGAYGQMRDYTRQTPITEWKISIGEGGLQGRDLDLAGLKGLRMEFWCDVTLLDGVRPVDNRREVEVLSR